ncbi:DUF2335 domain-containing protein [Candidatus Magnetaquicoccus inordinatus]|uniref:DUF2335 domain-containing protein n=1 Tax=Candidatus Magnetaquicoccus inordinatus TaxID=2496818 RepID=UPI00102B3608|nr:DUF2335 domain-containing protein [Candidatus Magnetaquicoccus inordinatus]
MNGIEKAPATEPVATEGLQPENAQQKVVVVQHTQEFMGPIPSPQILTEYSHILPDLPERIVKRFEEESRHRAAMEKEAWAFHRRGQWMALFMGVVALIIAAVLTLSGHDGVGGTIGGVTVTGLVGAFIAGKLHNSKDT